MAAPNIVNVSALYGRTTSATPANTTANVLLANAAASGKVYKINMLVATNVDSASGYSATVARNSAADGSGTSTALINASVVPLNASLVVVDKTTMFYLQENESIVVTSSGASKISYTVSYEDIS